MLTSVPALNALGGSRWAVVVLPVLPAPAAAELMLAGTTATCCPIVRTRLVAIWPLTVGRAADVGTGSVRRDRRVCRALRVPQRVYLCAWRNVQFHLRSCSVARAPRARMRAQGGAHAGSPGKCPDCISVYTNILNSGDILQP